MTDEERMYHLITYIARDWVELSQEKVLLQRNDYITKCRALLKELNKDD